MNGNHNINASGVISPGASGLSIRAESFLRLHYPTQPSSANFSSDANFDLTVVFTPQPCIWKNSVDGDFTDATKWVNDKASTPVHAATFDKAGAYTVTLDEPVTVSGLRVLDGDVTFDVSNGALTVTDAITTTGVIRGVGPGGVVVSSAIVAAGASADEPPLAASSSDTPACGDVGVLCLASPFRPSDGAFFTAAAEVVVDDVIVDGNPVRPETGNRARFDLLDSSTLTVERITIGDDKGGHFRLDSNSHLIANTITLGNEANVIGANANGELLNDGGLVEVSQTLLIGRAGVGEVSVIGGGALHAANLLRIGESETSKGELNIAGGSANSRSRVTFQNLEVSVSGSALEPGEGGVAVAEGAELVVRQDIGGGQITIGRRGSLFIGSDDTDHRSFVGTRSPTRDPVKMVVDWVGWSGVGVPPFLSSQTPKVEIGPGGSLTVNEMEIGVTGRGELKLNSNLPLNRAIAEITQKLTLGRRADLIATAEVHVGEFDSVVVGQGTAAVGEFRVAPGGVLAGSGKIFAPSFVVEGDVSDFRRSGFVTIGTSPGRLVIDGDFRMEGGFLELEVGGTDPAMFQTEASTGDLTGLHDVLEVTGDADFLGTLIVKFVDGFAPTMGQTFDLIDVGGAINFSPSAVLVQGLLPGFEYSFAPDPNGRIALTALNDGRFVPEPATIVLLIMALAAGSGRRLKRYRQTEDAR